MRTREPRSFLWVGLLGALIGSAMWAGIIYVAVHLVGKYW